MKEPYGPTTGPSAVSSLPCPRCDSMDTKFCYFNNYSTTQPRHFCKNCRRYWTQGGSLRNVPVGGGCRKNKRLSKASSILSSCTASMASPPPLPSSSSSACNFSANAARMMAMDPPGLLMDMNHLDMLTNLNAHHHHHRHWTFIFSRTDQTMAVFLLFLPHFHLCRRILKPLTLLKSVKKRILLLLLTRRRFPERESSDRLPSNFSWMHLGILTLNQKKKRFYIFFSPT